MSRVITTARLGTGAAHQLAAVRPDELDPTVRALVAAAAEEAYGRGLREGEVRGAAAAETRAVGLVDQLGAGVSAALERAAQAARTERDETVESAFELALAMAAAILGHEPHDGGAAVAARVRETLGLLEDPSPVVRVHPDDRDVLARALADVRGVTVEADPTLVPGEARITGGWAEADLTHATAFAAIRRDLGVDR
jgi:flagellar biosynthesis/type III secretory pathway protein FliH